MPIKFLVFLGGVGSFLEWGVEVPISFLWAWGFFRFREFPKQFFSPVIYIATQNWGPSS